jgi:hypothetical protein
MVMMLRPGSASLLSNAMTKGTSLPATALTALGNVRATDGSSMLRLGRIVSGAALAAAASWTSGSACLSLCTVAGASLALLPSSTAGRLATLIAPRE